MNKNVYIEKLTFSINNCFAPEESFHYKFKNNQGELKYSFGFKILDNKIVEFDEYVKISQHILTLVKNWKRQYDPKIKILDGILWELKIKLSNGNWICSNGHHTFPPNYNKFYDYLNSFVGIRGLIQEYKQKYGF